MNRADLQKLSNTRLREARLLFDAREYSGAYYLAGYAVECALKACFAKRVQRYDFPSKDAEKIFTHNFRDLVRLANWETNLGKSRQIQSLLQAGSWFVNGQPKAVIPRGHAMTPKRSSMRS